MVGPAEHLVNSPATRIQSRTLATSVEPAGNVIMESEGVGSAIIMLHCFEIGRTRPTSSEPAGTTMMSSDRAPIRVEHQCDCGRTRRQHDREVETGMQTKSSVFEGPTLLRSLLQTFRDASSAPGSRQTAKTGISMFWGCFAGAESARVFRGVGRFGQSPKACWRTMPLGEVCVVYGRGLGRQLAPPLWPDRVARAMVLLASLEPPIRNSWISGESEH